MRKIGNNWACKNNSKCQIFFSSLSQTRKDALHHNNLLKNLIFDFPTRSLWRFLNRTLARLRFYHSIVKLYISVFVCVVGYFAQLTENRPIRLSPSRVQSTWQCRGHWSGRRRLLKISKKLCCLLGRFGCCFLIWLTDLLWVACWRHYVSKA